MIKLSMTNPLKKTESFATQSAEAINYEDLHFSMKEAIFLPIIMLAIRQIVSTGNPGTGKSGVFLP